MTSRNIVVVMSDDHGQWCLGPYGNNEVQTPTLDHLSDTGVRMDNSFCPSPVCSPSRASFFTGLRPSQHGIHDWIRIDAETADSDWLAGERTLPQILDTAGYSTGLSGKWHCGRGRGEQDFDFYRNMHHDGRDVNKFSLERDRQVTDGALEFLRSERSDDAPFFLFVGYTATHGGWKNEPERLVSQYRDSPFDDVPDDVTYPHGRGNVIRLEDPNEARANYYAAVQGIDEQVGRLVDELDEQSVLDETLVVYTSDHGHNCGHHGIWGKGNGTVPQNMLEESIRVPLLLSQHEAVEGGQARSEFVDHCDLFQTLLEFANVEPPDTRKYPGWSFIDQIVEVRGDPSWEQRQLCEYGDVHMIRTERYKFVRQHSEETDLLFDLERDPRESTNVIDQPAYEDVVDRLRSTLSDLFDQYVDAESDGRDGDSLPSFNQGSEPWTQQR